MRKTYVPPRLVAEEYVQDTMIASFGPSKTGIGQCWGNPGVGPGANPGGSPEGPGGPGAPAGPGMA